MTAVIAPAQATFAISSISLVSLFGMGALSARIGGAPPLYAAIRVTFWGALAMGLTAAVGWMFDAAVLTGA